MAVSLGRLGAAGCRLLSGGVQLDSRLNHPHCAYRRRFMRDSGAYIARPGSCERLSFLAPSQPIAEFGRATAASSTTMRCIRSRNERCANKVPEPHAPGLWHVDL
jgi:hypothetical protein